MQVKCVAQSYSALIQNHWMNTHGFPERLKAACRDAGLPVTQPALARAFGLSTTTIWHYLHGEKLPSMDTAIAIAGKLGVCVEWLLTGNGPQRSRDTLDISQLPDAAKSSLKTLLESFSEPKNTEKAA